MQLSDRVLSIKESPTLAITAKAVKLKSEGKDVIALAAGEPDFDTPIHIKEFAKKAIDAGQTKYTAVGGTPVLKQAIIDKFKRENNVTYAANEILVSVGGKHSFFNLCMAYINPGDEAIIPAPYWVSYPDIVTLAGGVPVIVGCGIEQNYKLTAAQLDAAITPKTKLLVINSPSNPSGAVYTLDELKALAAVLKKHPQVLVASDDMYEHILLGDTKFCNILDADPSLKEQVMLFNGVSKAYSMTGWRIGYVGGPAALVKAMEKIQSQSTTSPAAMSQAAAVEALNGDQSCIAPMTEAFNRRHNMVIERLNKMRGIKCLPAGGSFYAYPDCREAIQNLYNEGKIAETTDMAFGDYLLEKALVAIVPGSAFGTEGYFRLSFATSDEVLKEAMDRIEKVLA